jgi:alkylated DNA repair dioxygenase AlkB
MAGQAEDCVPTDGATISISTSRKTHAIHDPPARNNPTGTARFAQVEPGELVQALLIRYDPGARIGWHRKRPVFEHVVGISLGAPPTMRFRRRRPGGFDRASAFLAPRSIYYLAGEARHEWEHSIAEMEVTRWSITFRSLSQNAREQKTRA